MNTKPQETVWITWETQRRNWELADAFAAEYSQFDYSSKGKVKRYVRSVFDTYRLLIKRRPRVVFAQNPSLVLCTILALSRKIFSFRLVVDLHNVAVEQCSSPSWVVRTLARYVCRKSDLSIVTNPMLVPHVVKYNRHVAILPDRLPTLPKVPAPAFTKRRQRPHATLISSFASDEPIEIFLKAVSEIDLPFTLFVTGSKRKARELLSLSSDKIVFTDFLTHDEYIGLITESDFLIDLTTRDDCLVCGAYEALAAEVPCILSRTPVIEKLFGSWAFLTDNKAESFKQTFFCAMMESSLKRACIPEAKKVFLSDWNSMFKQIWSSSGLADKKRAW